MPDIDGGDLLTDIEQQNPKLGIFLRSTVLNGINTVAKHASVAPSGDMQPPSAPGGINVKVAGEMAHVTINDDNEIQRNVEYQVEYADNPSFSGAHVEHLGSSRGRVLNLPTFPDPNPDDPSPPPHNWYFRTYSQYPGSNPSPITTYGAENPTPVNMAGTTALTLQPSTGSGTALGNGSQSGWGLGKVVQRPVPSPKRNVGS